MATSLRAYSDTKLKRGLRLVRVEGEERAVWLRFRRNLSVSLLGAALSTVIKSGQTLILAKVLSLEDYGRVLIVLNLIVFLNTFLGLRVSDLMFRFFRPLEEQGDARAVQGLLLFCLGVSAAIGLLTFGGVLLLSPWLAGQIYRSPALAPLFIIYGCTVLVSSLGDVYGAILRMYDRFTSLVVPQVMGGLTTFVILIAYAATASHYDMKAILAAFAVGALVQNVPPLIGALRLIRAYLTDIKPRLAARALFKYRAELSGCLFNSNVYGYLKIATSPGDLFFLGLFSSPSQVALYGLAKQLIAPLAILLTNVQTALTPEITSIMAKRKLEQTKRLAGRYIALAILAGGLLIGCALLVGRSLILLLFRPEYVGALPVFYVLLIVAWVQLVYAAFRPIALSLDLLKWDNLAQLLSAAVLFLFLLAGRIDALTMAFIQLACALVLRLLFNLPVWVRLSALALDSEQRDVP